MKLSSKDLETLQHRGITVEQLQEELEMLKVGFPFLRLYAAATPQEGIKIIPPDGVRRSLAIWDKYLKEGKGKVLKMVPASGAASRMFKDLYEFLNSPHDKPHTPAVKEFFDRIEDFPFFRRLNLRCMQITDKSINTLIAEGRYKEIVAELLKKSGMAYGEMPKGLLSFHRVPGSNRTPLEEHLDEAACYATGKDGKARVHFTVSHEHVPYFRHKIEEVKAFMQHRYGVEYDITLSEQKPSTDTPAMMDDGTIYRENGEIFFRPGGHGALIRNLNDLDADVVFIKNIDNVLPEEARDTTVEWKRILGGVLVGVKTTIDHYCHRLASSERIKDDEMKEMITFLRDVLCVTHDGFDALDYNGRKDYLMSKFNRPLRVCGMVKNEGEPGGGPYLVYGQDGTVAPQILESSQINKKDKASMEMMKKATHFNPVDLVVALKDYRGKKFDLLRFVDKSTGFISSKSREGVEFKALELPGLWNGAMADWNTIFVEVPADTFSPVKTVNDLLRPAHQA